MDKQKLEALRRRYSDVGAFSIDDPVLKAAAADLAAGDEKRPLPYSGIATFLGLPAAADAAGLEVALVGLPTDLGVTNRSGARFGRPGVVWGESAFRTGASRRFVRRRAGIVLRFAHENRGCLRSPAGVAGVPDAHSRRRPDAAYCLWTRVSGQLTSWSVYRMLPRE